MHIDLRDLNLFSLIAETKSLTRAAERNHLSLPAVSARIKDLETEAGVRLLYRAPRGVALTPAGQSLLRHARTILSEIEHMKSELQRYGEGVQGSIRVFANTTAVTEFMPEVLATFLAAHQKVDVDLQERPTAEIIRGVLDGMTDLGITSGPIAADGLEVHTFSSDRLVLAVAPGHPLAPAAAVRFSDVIDHDYIGLHEGSTLQQFVDQLMQNARRRLHIRVQVSNFESVCRMVEAGVGVGIVPESAALRHRRTMKILIKQLDEDWALRERHVLARRGEALPSYTQALIDSIMNHPGHAASRARSRKRGAH
ncbi:LysR family transcriptional regulator [Pseudothauera rhizosphaerae]|uniref:LysR family transcriptional regulator n=1 Tax=Pseudothauera rhizosphaerae TaxID=2565932 RepID=A0A4S4ALV0_9RHOO|nr:LysR family transcriptional regulator [Pseudothauera rhizosphaerae]THF60540.1 LysR family transcriptional regulator [Pseudothauera rhizosphaerae]